MFGFIFHKHDKIKNNNIFSLESNRKLVGWKFSLKIAQHLCISKRSVFHIIRHFQHFGCVKPLPSLYGRPRLLSSDDMKYLDIILKEKIDWYIWEIQNEMEM